MDGADAIVVKTQDGELRPASLLFSEGSADVALLQLDSPDLDLPHARLGDSDELAVGQDVYVVGRCGKTLEVEIDVSKTRRRFFTP